MAKIPIYESEVPAPRPNEEAPHIIARLSASIGEDYRQMGNVAKSTFDTFNELEARKEISDGMPAVAKAAFDYGNQLEDKINQADPNDPQFHDIVNKFMTDEAGPGFDKILDGVDTSEAHDRLQEAIAKAKLDIWKSGTATQTGVYGINWAKEFDKQADNWSMKVFNDSTQYDAAVTAIDLNGYGAVHGLARLSMADWQKARIPALHEIAESAFQSVLNSGNIKLLEQMANDPKFDGILSPKERQKYLTGAHDVQGEIAAQALPSVIEALKNGDTSPTRIQQAVGLAKGDTHGSPAEAQVRQAARARDIEDAVAIGNAAHLISGMTDGEVHDKIIGPAQQAALSASPDDLGPIQKTIAATQAALKSRAEGIKAQGGQYFIDNPTLYPSVSAAFRKFEQTGNPTDFQAYAASVTAAEKRVDPQNPPRVLPTDLYNKVGAELQAAQNTPDGAASFGQTLSGLHELVGANYWNGVVHELMANGKLKPSQFAAAQLMGDPRSWSLAQEIIRASMVPDADLTKSTGKPKEPADKVASTAMKSLMVTFADTTNGHELVSAYVDAISQVMRSRGTVDQSAANALAQTMVLDRFNIRNNLRIPTEFDDRDVADGANNVLASIDKHNLVPPPSFSGLGAKPQFGMYVSDIKDFGHWSTNARGDGALLYDQYGAPVYEKVKNGSVVQVEVPFKDLASIGKNIRGPLNQARRFFTNPESLSGTPFGATGGKRPASPISTEIEGMGGQ